MTSITGTIRIGEAMPTVNATARSLRGSPWWFYAAQIVALFGVGGLGVGLSYVAGIDLLIGWCIGALAGALMYYRLSKVLSLWRFRKTLTGKGVPLDIAIRLEATPEAFCYEIGDIASRAKWQAVTEVFQEKGWLIFMVQGNPWFAADRFFATDADKRAFLGEALSYMSAEARARSAAAVKFAAQP
jgi:hypothetical protein